MGIRGVLECEVDIKSSGDLFHELFETKPHEASNISPEIVHACELHEGEFGKPGSVIFWHYPFDGKVYSMKQIVEVINKEKKTIRFKGIDGEEMRDYKSFVITLQVIPNGEITSVKWTMEFEKIRDDGPYLTKHMDIVTTVTKDIEARHLQA